MASPGRQLPVAPSPHGHFLLLPSDNNSLLLKSIAVSELMLPSDVQSPAEGPSNSAISVIASCLDQVNITHSPLREFIGSKPCFKMSKYLDTKITGGIGSLLLFRVLFVFALFFFFLFFLLLLFSFSSVIFSYCCYFCSCSCFCSCCCSCCCSSSFWVSHNISIYGFVSFV